MAAALRSSALDAEAGNDFLRAARDLAEALQAQNPEFAAVRVLGPAPAAMARRADRHHAQLLLESGDRGALHRLLTAWVPRIEALPQARKLRWALDVDPLELF